MTAAAEDEGKQAGPGEEPPQAEKVAEVLNVFMKGVNAPGSVFGNADAAGGRRIEQDTGTLGECHVRLTLEHYARPACQAAAEQALRDDHVVFIDGQRGVGKHTAAISVLRSQSADPLISLHPDVTPDDLVVRGYERGHGYLVLDHTDTVKEAGTDFVWARVRDAVREAGAFLVITRTSEAPRASETVAHVFWERPDLTAVLRAHLGAESGAVDALAAAIPADCPMRDVAHVAEKVSAGTSVQEALRDLDIASARTVREWFSEPRTRRELLELTTLAFVTGNGEREFESRLARLEAEVEVRFPLPEQEPVESGAEPELDQSRVRRLGEESLMKTERVIRNKTPVRVLVFKNPGYRSFVLAELSTRMSTQFWDAVKDWISKTVQGEVDFEIALGLALLAETDPVEVEGSYLEPWSTGELGKSGRDTATIVLWLMCFDEASAPIALRIARGWAIFGSREQRLTSAVVFSGALAAKYPTEALRRSWKLIEQSRVAEHDDYVWAFAALFATLVQETDNSAIALGLLARVLDDFDTSRPRLRTRDLTMRSVIAVLTVGDKQNGWPAICSFIRKRPDRTGLVASLWAAALRNRLYRADAVNALLTCIDALTPEETCGLGEELAEAMPDDELVPLRQALITMRRFAVRRDRDALIDVLLKTLQNRGNSEESTS